jgi:hypothetical protein
MIHRDQFWLYGCLLAGIASAHESFESSTTARLEHGRLEVVLTLSSYMAAYLVRTGDVEHEPIPAYGSYHTRLEALAPGFLNVAAGGLALRPQQINVRQNQSGEPEIAYFYPPPPSGPLRFDALYLRGLPPRFFGRVEVMDADDRLLGNSLLVAEKTVAEISPRLPAPSGEPATGAVVAEVTPAPAPVAGPGLFWLMGGAGLAVGGAAWLLVRSRRRSRD